MTDIRTTRTGTTVEITPEEMAGPVTLTRDSYLGSDFWTLPEGMVLTVPTARRNPGHRFRVTIFDTTDELNGWVGQSTAGMIARHIPDAVGKLSALPSVIAREPINDTPIRLRMAPGDRLRTSQGDFLLAEIPLHDPFLIPAPAQ